MDNGTARPCRGKRPARDNRKPRGLGPDPSHQTGGIQFWGSSFVAGPQGELVFRAGNDDECEQVVEIDLARSEQVRRWWPFLRDRRIDKYEDILRRFVD